MTAELKDLFKAIKIHCIFINRTGDTLADRNTMLDYKQEALADIEDYESKHSLSKHMKEFLLNRVYQTAMQQQNWR